MQNKKKILVTGGCGFIGSHTVVALIENGFEPIIVDSLANSDKFIVNRIEKITNSTIQFYHADCCNYNALDSIFTRENFTSIIHFAAFKAVGESVNDPLKYYQNNLVALINLLELCKKHNINEFVFSSSCTVYGTPEKIPVTEKNLIAKAESPYGNTKIIAEQIIIDFIASCPEFKAVLLRYFNPIGSHPSALIGELPIGVPNNLVPYITQTAIGKRKQLTIFGNDYPTKDGTCIRDYIHVCDLANAHVAALNKLKSFKSNPEIFNLGSGMGNSVLEVVTTFEKANHIKLNYTFGPRRSGDVTQIFANVEKANTNLEWHCKYTLQDALIHAWQWEKNLNEEKNS